MAKTEALSRYNLLIAALSYVDQFDILKNIGEICRRYNTQNDLFYSFDIEINPQELLNQNASLGNLLLNSQKDVTLLFHELIYHYITIQNSIKVSPNQILVVLHLLSIPNIPGVYTIRTFSDLLKIPEMSRVICLKGIVLGMTAVSKYSHYTMYLCPERTCKGSRSKEYIRTHVPGALETQTIQNNFVCVYCGTALIEAKSYRTLAEKIIVDVLPSDAFAFSNNQRYQAIPIYVRGSISKKVTLGLEHQFFGIIRRDFVENKISLTVEANNVIPSPEKYQCSSFSQVPQNLKKMFKKIAPSPWRFALSLSFYFAGDISPPGTFWKLKLCLLLNLVSSLNAENLLPLHLLVIGKETSIISKLLLHSLAYCQRVIKHNTNNCLTGKACKDMYGTSPYYIKAGSLILASNGICYLGDISCYKKTLRDKLQSVIMSNKISIEVESKFTDSLPQILQYPLKCQLWTYCDSKSTAQTQTSDKFLMKCNSGDLPKCVLDAFDILVYTDPSTFSESDELISHHLLSVAMGSKDNNFSSFDSDMHGLLKCLQGWQVSMSKKSKRMIEEYYLASQRIRSYNMDESSVPVSAIEVITKYAISFAKLSLQHQVTECEILMAIRLYEETLLSRFGVSVFNISLSNNILFRKLEPFLKYNDEVMEKFYSYFTQHCHRFGDIIEE